MRNAARKPTFTKAEIDAVARQARAGIRLALMVRPDGSKVVMPAGDADCADVASDLDARLAAFGAS